MSNGVRSSVASYVPATSPAKRSSVAPPRTSVTSVSATPFACSSARRTNAKPVLSESTASFLPRRSAIVRSGACATTLRKPWSTPITATRSGSSSGGPSPWPSW
jgi:hypothetical protein